MAAWFERLGPAAEAFAPSRLVMTRIRANRGSWHCDPITLFSREWIPHGLWRFGGGLSAIASRHAASVSGSWPTASKCLRTPATCAGRSAGQSGATGADDQATASSSTSGCLSAIEINIRAAPDGSRLPCSQLRRVLSPTPSRPAKASWVRLRDWRTLVTWDLPFEEPVPQRSRRDSTWDFTGGKK